MDRTQVIEDPDRRPTWMLGIAMLALAAVALFRDIAANPALPPGIPLSALGTIKTGGDWNAPGNHVFTTDVLIDLGTETSFQFLDLSLDNNDVYRLDIATTQGFQPIHTILPAGGYGLARREIAFAAPVQPTTRLRIVAVSGDGLYSLGHLLVR